MSRCHIPSEGCEDPTWSKYLPLYRGPRRVTGSWTWRVPPAAAVLPNKVTGSLLSGRGTCDAGSCLLTPRQLTREIILKQPDADGVVMKMLVDKYFVYVPNVPHSP